VTVLALRPALCRLRARAHGRQVYGGRALTDDEITGLLIATLFAGQHTSSITSAWTGYLMIANKARRRPRALPAARCASRPASARGLRLLARAAPGLCKVSVAWARACTEL